MANFYRFFLNTNLNTKLGSLLSTKITPPLKVPHLLHLSKYYRSMKFPEIFFQSLATLFHNTLFIPESVFIAQHVSATSRLITGKCLTNLMTF